MTAYEGDSTRTVYCEDALAWLEKCPIDSGYSFVASLPDISEFSNDDLQTWKSWFTHSAELILSRTPPEGVTIFYQSDIKIDGAWVDKGYLCLKSAEQLGHRLLWHKIACRYEPGQATYGRCGYSHIVCFSKELRLDSDKSSADVLPDLGKKIWERGMGINACMMIATFIKEQSKSHTIVNPFCGQGSMLAAANSVGLSAIGIERSEKRAEFARGLHLDLERKTWDSTPRT